MPLALIVGGAYLWVGLGVSGFRSWDELYAWAAGYTQTGFWGGAVDGAKLTLLGEGLAGTFADPNGALVGAVLLGALLLNLRRLARAPRGAVPVTLVWLAVYGAFFLWWEPENIEFWIASLPPFYLLVALAVFGPPPRAVWPTGPLRLGRGGEIASLGPPLVAAACLMMLVSNGVAIKQRGDSSRDLQRVAAAAVAARSAPGDLIMAPDGLPELYLPFYEGRPNVFSLSQATTATGGAWPAACALIRERIELTLASDYAVLVADEAIHPRPAPPGEPPTPAERLGLAPETVAACYDPLMPALEPLPAADGLPPYFRIPPAQELADGAGWAFARGPWGWRAANAEPATSPLPGLAVLPGVDPSLTSPPLRIDTARYSALEVRLASTTASREAQLFFLDEAGQVDEARSVRWELGPGAEPATYRLELRDRPGWSGVVTGLRIDPVALGDGGIVVVESIRLVP